MEYTEDKKAFLVGPIILKAKDTSKEKSIALINDKDETVYPAAKSSDTFPTDIKWRKATYYDMVWGISKDEVSGITGESPVSPNIPDSAITTIYSSESKKMVSFAEGVYVKFLNIEYKDDDIDKDESDCEVYKEGCEVTLVITKTKSKNQQTAEQKAVNDIEKIIKAKTEEDQDIKVKNILYDVLDSGVTTYKGDAKKFTFTFRVKITSLLGDTATQCEYDNDEYQLVTSFNGSENSISEDAINKFLVDNTTQAEPILSPGMHIKSLMYCGSYIDKKTCLDVAKTRAQELAVKILEKSGFGEDDYTLVNTNIKTIYGPTKNEETNEYNAQVSYYAYIQPTNKKEESSGETSGGTDVKIESGLTGTYLLTAIEEIKDNKKLHYYYRVDEKYRKPGGGEKLAENNYTDNESFGLNSIYGLNVVKENFKSQIGDNQCYSFADVAMAIMGDKLLGFDKDLYSSENVAIITSLLEENVITQIAAHGYANSHGYTNANNTLSKQRGETIVNWLKTALSDKMSFVESQDNGIDTETLEYGEKNINNNVSVNDIGAKKYRCAEVKLSLRNKEIMNKYTAYSFDENEVYLFNEETMEKYGVSDRASFEEFMTEHGWTVEWLDDPRNPNNTNSVKGYGEEFLYFNRLKNEDPFIFNQLENKIKYFSPAYHSISPEGFTERLNFLQQCCRQGNTKMIGGQASNLAFGRPPVCVLRIGDFFYTKIIIQHLQIDYSKDLTWDLNPEGNGVQPMCAEVSISFKYLGGSDIAGPVSRLQNALSFNHYANLGTTSEYAETQQYIDGTGDSDKQVEITASKITLQ